MKQKFREARLSPSNRERLLTINGIIREYQSDGYVLTLRQLYYQLVSRDVIPNKQSEYSKLSGLLTEGRMAGIVDWKAIEDRLRAPESPNAFDSPEEAMDTIINVFASPRQEGQPVYMEVWVEKDALSGVLERVTRPYHIPIMVNRGYSSVTAMHSAFKRFKAAIESGQSARVLYVGDHDPSGVDMIRDIRERIFEFFKGDYIDENGEDFDDHSFEEGNIDFDIIPVALLRPQITKHKPPPNPAKIADPRAAKYIAEHGRVSWEVDALRPEVLNALLTKEIKKHIDQEVFDAMITREKKEKEILTSLKDHLE